jgi:Flp pilus assembly protein TadB
VSKERQAARAEREAARAQRQAEQDARRARSLARDARARRRQEVWRQVRWWQHGTGFRRDRWALLAMIILVCLGITFLLTTSWKTVGAVALVCLVAAPALGAFVFDRRSR